jgi:hypothetical protein
MCCVVQRVPSVVHCWDIELERTMRNCTLAGVGLRLAFVLAISTIGLWAQSAAAQDKPGRAATKTEYNGWRQ